MKRILSVALTVALLAAMFTFAASAETIELDNEYGTIHAIYGTPEIDGFVESLWDNAEIHYVDKPYSPDEATPDPICRFRMMYDDSYIYFLTEVYDCTMGDLEWESASVGGNLWKRDGVSYAFDPAYDRSDSGFPHPSFWFIIGSYGHTANWMGSTAVPDDVWIKENEGATPMFSISYVKDNEGNQIGYIIENKVNFNKLAFADVTDFNFKYQPGTQFGLSMACNDNNALIFSSTRNELMLLTTADGINHNNVQKATVILMDSFVSYTNSVEDLRFPTPADVYLEGESAPVVETTAEETTAAPVVTTAAEATTAAPAVTTAPEATTAAPADPTEAPAATTASPETTAPAKDNGCGSAMASAMLISLIAASAVVICKKKH